MSEVIWIGLHSTPNSLFKCRHEVTINIDRPSTIC